MKKLTTMAAAVLFAATMNAQQWNGNLNTTDHIHRNGNVSIGTDQNVDKLNLGGSLRLVSGDIAFGYHPPVITFPRSYTPNSDYRITYMPEENGTDPFPYSLPSALYFYPYIPEINYLDNRRDFSVLVLGSSGKIGMGTDQFSCSNCTNYRLFVKDGIKTEKIKVEIAASNGWADYVFEKDYPLMPLNELDQFIKTNGHLPEVPTTEEAIANGIELKEMNILLLKKVEELTLYTLQQQKQIDLQQKELQEQSKSLKELAEKIKNQN